MCEVIVPSAGFEPATRRLRGGCSNQLSYEGIRCFTGSQCLHAIEHADESFPVKQLLIFDTASAGCSVRVSFLAGCASSGI